MAIELQHWIIIYLFRARTRQGAGATQEREGA